MVFLRSWKVAHSNRACSTRSKQQPHRHPHPQRPPRNKQRSRLSSRKANHPFYLRRSQLLHQASSRCLNGRGLIPRGQCNQAQHLANGTGVYVEDITQNKTFTSTLGTEAPYSGSYINLTTGNLNILSQGPGEFIQVGNHGGTDTIDFRPGNGNNHLVAGGGNNLIYGGTGNDIFTLIGQGATPMNYTFNNLHAGDIIILSDLIPGGAASMTHMDNPATGVTLGLKTAQGQQINLTLTGYAFTDTTNGRLSLTFATSTVDKLNYLSIGVH